jgi:hypothetical protein
MKVLNMSNSVLNEETCEIDSVIVCDLKEDNCPYKEGV